MFRVRVLCIICIGVSDFFSRVLSLLVWGPPGKNEEASKVLETRLSKAKAGSDEEVSLKLCIAQVRDVKRPFALYSCTGLQTDSFPSPATVASECGYSLVAWRAVMAGGAVVCIVRSKPLGCCSCFKIPICD